jgi:hypothetical protein
VFRNLLFCSVGLLGLGLLGLLAQKPSLPGGVAWVNDATAAQVYGAAKSPCKYYKVDPNNYGCGLDAKPAMGGMMATKCQRTAQWLADPNGNYQGKEVYTKTCYECCYSCGTAQVLHGEGECLAGRRPKPIPLPIVGP